VCCSARGPRPRAAETPFAATDTRSWNNNSGPLRRNCQAPAHLSDHLPCLGRLNWLLMKLLSPQSVRYQSRRPNLIKQTGRCLIGLHFPHTPNKLATRINQAYITIACLNQLHRSLGGEQALRRLSRPSPTGARVYICSPLQNFSLTLHGGKDNDAIKHQNANLRVKFQKFSGGIATKPWGRRPLFRSLPVYASTDHRSPSPRNKFGLTPRA